MKYWLVALALCWPSVPLVAAERPNVLFLISDDLNNLLSCYDSDGDAMTKSWSPLP